MDNVRLFIRKSILEYYDDPGSRSGEDRLLRLIKRLLKQTKDADEIVHYIGKYYGHLFYDSGGPEKLKAIVQGVIQKS